MRKVFWDLQRHLVKPSTLIRTDSAVLGTPIATSELEKIAPQIFAGQSVAKCWATLDKYSRKVAKFELEVVEFVHDAHFFVDMYLMFGDGSKGFRRSKGKVIGHNLVYQQFLDALKRFKFDLEEGMPESDVNPLFTATLNMLKTKHMQEYCKKHKQGSLHKILNNLLSLSAEIRVRASRVQWLITKGEQNG